MNFKNTMMILAISATVVATACKKDDDNNVNPNAPTVQSTSPSSNAVGVVRNTGVSFTFSEDMDANSINENSFILKQGTNTIPGTLSYNGRTGTFTPTQPLAAGTIYAASLSTDVKNAAGVALANKVEWTFTTGGSTATLEPVNLGESGNYVILAKTAINNNPTSAITGDIALSPAATTFITGFDLTDDIGFATSAQITGRAYAADMADPVPANLNTAVANMNTAYDNAAGRTSPDFVELHAGNLGGKTLSAGVYKWSSNVTITSNMVINGSATDVWIFQIDGNLTMSAATIVTLTGGAKPENIFWQVSGEVIIRTTAQMKGIILSKSAITLETGASLSGRALAQTAVILDANVVTKPE